MVGDAKSLLKSLYNPPRGVHHIIKKGLPLLVIHTPPNRGYKLRMGEREREIEENKRW